MSKTSDARADFASGEVIAMIDVMRDRGLTPLEVIKAFMGVSITLIFTEVNDNERAIDIYTQLSAEAISQMIEIKEMNHEQL